MKFHRPGLSRALPGALFSLALVMFCYTGATARDVPTVGVVAAIEGNAIVVRNGQTIKVVQGMALETGDKLTTQDDGHVTVTFGNNSSLDLGLSATIIINENIAGGPPASITRVGLLGGHLHTIFNAGLRGIGRGLEVRTPNALLGVRGTEFDTAYIAGKPCPGFPDCLRYTDVGVLKGAVEVSNPLNPKAAPVLATAGYETTVPCEEPPSKPSPLGMEQMLTPSYR